MRTIIENAMLDTMFTVPGREDIKEVVVSDKTISSGENPLIVIENQASGTE